MKTYKFEDGFEVEVNDGIVQDYRFLKCLVKAMKNDDEIESANSLVTIISLLLGKNEDRFIDHVAEMNNGIAGVERLTTEVFKVIESIQVEAPTGETVEAGKN